MLLIGFIAFKHPEDPKILITWLILIIVYLVYATITDNTFQQKKIQKKFYNKKLQTQKRSIIIATITLSIIIIIMLFCVLFFTYQNNDLKNHFIISLLEKIIQK